MSELTVITTVEITDIHRNVPEDYRIDKEELAKFLKAYLKGKLNSDNVVVTNIQEFETDFSENKEIDWETEWHELRRQMEVKEAVFRNAIKDMRKEFEELLKGLR